MGKRLLNLSIYSLLGVILLTSIQCKRETDPRTREIKAYLKAKFDIEPDGNTDRIYVINDRGCGNCVLSLSEFVKGQVHDNRALILINSRGTNVDLDAFERRKNPNIVIRHQPINDENDLFYHSGAIYLTEGKVDTIINLSGDDLEGRLRAIFEREKQ